mmetsp:Transcript_34291/g.102481  ORF Transcript_34291/g.102481 Transcript_34291/m.102481 type:complete len:294 (+) Transcript_34291:639-1520(+)
MGSASMPRSSLLTLRFGLAFTFASCIARSSSREGLNCRMIQRPSSIPTAKPLSSGRHAAHVAGASNLYVHRCCRSAVCQSLAIPSNAAVSSTDAWPSRHTAVTALECALSIACSARPPEAKSQTFIAGPPAETKLAQPGKGTPPSTGCPWTDVTTHVLSDARRSHSLTLPSCPAVTQASGPPAPDARTFRQSEWASMVCRSSPVATSQVRSRPSRPPVAARLRSAEAKAAQVTASPWPLNLRSDFFVSRSKTEQVPAASPARSSLPSPLQAVHWVASLNLESVMSFVASPRKP